MNVALHHAQTAVSEDRGESGEVNASLCHARRKRMTQIVKTEGDSRLFRDAIVRIVQPSDMLAGFTRCREYPPTVHCPSRQDLAALRRQVERAPRRRAFSCANVQLPSLEVHVTG